MTPFQEVSILAAMPTWGATVADRYALEREIGHGSMSTVWAALDTRLGRRVALKRLEPGAPIDQRARARFEHEARAIAQFRNEHVVQVYDAGVDGEGAPFIAMELLEGETLEGRLNRIGRLSLPAAAEIVDQIAAALSPAHALGIIHRDLKPANIFVARTDRGEVLKLLDFGVAAMTAGWLNAALSQAPPGELAGTPQFMSPEQLQRGEVDRRSDLWALAVVAYHLLTRRWPFAGRTFPELAFAICRAEFAPVDSALPEARVAINNFFARGLAKEPAARFQSASDLARTFAGLAAPEGARAARILVIDDEPDMEVLLRQRFRRRIAEGRYQLLFARDGIAGLEQLKSHPDIDVALTDIRMPGMDGLTFLAEAAAVNPIAKVVMVSAYGDMANIRQAMNRGAFDFLLKPIDFQDLDVTIAKCLKQTADLRQALRSTEENDVLRLFVARGLVERLVAAIRSAAVPSNETIDGTVAFIGIHGASGLLSSSAPADYIFKQLNEQFDVIVPEVTAEGGLVDRFIGDLVVAVFIGPRHVERAVAASLAARDRVKSLAEAHGAESPPHTRGVAIGLAAGAILSGCVGSRRISRLDHAILGGPVTTAALLQGEAGEHEILIPESLTAHLVHAYDCDLRGTRPIGGAERRPTDVRCVVRRTDAGDGAQGPDSLHLGAMTQRASAGDASAQ